jgi:hypothetical protein
MSEANIALMHELLGLLKAIPDCRMARGIRFPQWYLLLVGLLSILSGGQSLRDHERFARRHHDELTRQLGLSLKRSPSDTAFRALLEKLDPQALNQVLQRWMLSHPALQEFLQSLLCDGKTLRGSKLAGEDASQTFVAVVTVYVQALGVALAQASYRSDQSHEQAALQGLLIDLPLEEAVVQADALHTNQDFFVCSRSVEPATC